MLTGTLSFYTRDIMPERILTDHKVNTVNDGLTVRVCDGAGSGGASHRYKIDGPEQNIAGYKAPSFQCDLQFQNGPVAEVGTNGITHEALLAVLVDRLRGFQSGPFSCRENAIALTKIEEAMMWLKSRTEKRLARGVEGTHTV